VYTLTPVIPQQAMIIVVETLRFPKLPEITIPKESGKKAIFILVVIIAISVVLVLNTPKIVSFIGGSKFQIANESIRVVQCFSYQNPSGMITVVALVQNTGKSNAVITSIYIYDRNGLEVASNNSLLITIPPGKASPVFIRTFALEPGNVYKVSVFTEVGTSSSCHLNFKEK